MLRQLREPLLAVLRTSPDFRPAYDPLLNLAGAVARFDDADARTLLTALAQTSPARPEATLLLQELGQQSR
jgi:spermidine synthase